jgi:acyl transferase domain-containing protein
VSSDRRAILTEALRKIDDLSARLAVAEAGECEPVAVVGMGCRLPGGVSDPDGFWRLLVEGRSGVVRVPAGRWDADAFYDADRSVPGTICTTEGGFVTSWRPDEFDAEFFGISPREAAAMDPQQRLLLEVSWEALEHAGLVAQQIRGTQTGIYVGLTTNDYSLLFANKLSPEDIDPYLPFGNAANFAAGRLSYFLGARGPAVVVDTACSSSLVSVHLACQSLRRGESDMALAAGVNLMLSPENSIACSRWGMLAPDGRCKTFDAGADGYVRSEGCGVVVLKRLSDAVAAGDRVWAVVRGSAVNQDGASSGQTVPNGPAQQALIRQALAASRLAASEVDYVEAHGTGTALGDPIELDALAGVFGDRGESAPLVLGSVKTNLGHLESGAGIAGFIKTVLSLRHGYIPKHLHFERLTPHAGPGAARFRIATEGMDWPVVGRARRAGVSSFGVSGTNAHVILEQAPATEITAATSAPAVSTLVVSGKSEQRIAATAGRLAQWMSETDVDVAEVAHTLNHHRARHGKFATVCARDRVQAVTGLRALSAGHAATGVVAAHEGVCGSGTVFVFSGQGSQWAGMGRRLLVDEPVFASAVAELEPVFVEQVGFSLREVLEGGQPVAGDGRVQPVLMGLQVALAALWRSRGVAPDAVIGHSMGEVSAAVVAGALSVAQGLRVIAVRSRLMARLAGRGAVALVECDAAQAGEVIAGFGGVEVAGFVSPSQTVVAGPPDAVDAVIGVVAGAGRFARRVNMEVASHTALMDPILDELAAELADVVPAVPVIPVFSTVDETVAPALDGRYWVANVRRPVRLAQAVAAAGARYTTFVEISAHPVLTHAISETLAATHHHAVGTLTRDGDDTVAFHTHLNTIHTTTPPHTPHPPEPHPLLPTTPWHHQHHWITTTATPSNAKRPNAMRRTGIGTPDTVPAEWRCELTWPVHELPETVTAATASWLVIGDADVGAQLRRQLGGATRVTVLQDDAAELADALAAAAGNVVYAPPVSAETFDVRAGHRLFNTARALVAALATTPTARLYLLTRNAQPLTEGDRANPAHAVLWGLGRTLALEHPEIWRAVVDVDELVPAELVARYLIAEAGCADGEDQIVYRTGDRHVPRLQPAAAAGAQRRPFDPHASHLVIGATGNIGPHLIQQLAGMGAGTVVAVSRHPGDRLRPLTEALAARGTTLVTIAADAADEASMTAVFDRFGTDLPPLAGIYLAAFGGGPVTLTDMTDADVETMFAPKLDAAVVLHKLSISHRVRHFVLFTSISGLIGSRWLAHYTATTTFLDTLAYARRAAGLPATAVNWGFWKSLADNESEEYRRVTLESGLEAMPDEVAIEALWSVTGPGAPVRSTVVAADWGRLAAAYRTRAPMHIIDDLASAAGDDTAPDDWAGADPLRDMTSADAERVIGDRVRLRLAAILGYHDASGLDGTVPLIELGMDSLLAVRIRQAVALDFGVEPPVGLLLQGGSLGDVTFAVMDQLGIARSDGSTAVDAVRDKATQRAAARRDAAVRRRKGQRA